MKRFKTISIAFIAVIAAIFGSNVYYLVTLYHSIRATVERDVRSALADADLDELWTRAENASGTTLSMIESGHKKDEDLRKGEFSAGLYKSGTIEATSISPDGTTDTTSLKVDDSHSFNAMMAQAIARQFHTVLDPYVEIDLNMMDSIVTRRLNDRFIFPDYICAEIIDVNGELVKGNLNYIKGDYDVFTHCYDTDSKLSYRIYVTPLTGHIFSKMAGVIVTVLLLMVSFALAFWYLFRTVSRLRTIEEMKDDFVNNMTHELKTPIAIAYSANDALLNYDTDNDRMKKEKYLRIANKQLKRLSELVENILAMSMERRKTMCLNRENIALQPFLEDIAAAHRMRKEKEITIDVEADDNLIVEADRTHLVNVISNLIDNAIKYSGETVHITVRSDADGISVADNGIGIPARAIPFLFNKFYRVPHGNRQDVRGYGIGLYYVRSILDKMGWAIDVRSKEGEGSVFTIKFGKDEK